MCIRDRWGTGTARREFLYSDDLGDAVACLLAEAEQVWSSLAPDAAPLINVGCSEDLTIKSLAELIATVAGFEGEIVWDRARPDGTPRKQLDVSRMTALGWRPRTTLKEGISLAYADYRARAARGEFRLS